ncbi:MAG TPA: hypothetical protein VMZ53_11830 [Kofleriaceae bacterium]|nr:hypothetical protein [Kofleriaceae bacterium]
MRVSLYLALAFVAGCSVPDFFLVDAGHGGDDGGADAKPDAALDAPPGAATISFVSSSNTDGYYKAADTISIQVTFSEAVTVDTTGGTPTLTLNSGASASYASGSGTTILTFSYTVAAGNAAADLEYTTATALSANGGTIKNGSVNAFLVLPVPGAAGSLGANKAIVIDAVAPTISAVTGPNAYAPSASATLSYAVTDANPGTTTCTQVTGTGTMASCTATGVTFSGLNQGAHTISITHTDAAGNISAAQTYSWTVDTTAPVVSTISGPALFAPSTSASLTYSVTETNQGTTTCTFTTGSGTITSCTASGASVTGMNQGAHTISVTHTDLATNASTAQTYSWTVDTVDPVISITGPTNNWTAGNNVSLTVSITDANPSTTSCAHPVGTGTQTNCSPTALTYTGLSTGAHEVHVIHTDRAGNTTDQTYTFSVCPPVSFATPSIPNFQVPTGCGTVMDVQAWGAGGAGGASNGGAGGGGGYARGTLTVAAGQSFIIRVGGGGTRSTTGAGGRGFNDGGSAGLNGGGGGGWSGVNFGNGSDMLRAPGGGGGGGCNGAAAGGGGGGLNGSPGGGSLPGGGASQGAAGVGGGTGSSGGVGQGGSGGDSASGCSGGGGGGGRFGGGGGNGPNTGPSSGAGGGGSVFLDSSLASTMTQAGTGVNAGGVAEPNYINGRGFGGSSNGGTGGDGLVVLHVHP